MKNKGRLTLTTSDWYTPISIVEKVKRVIGEIDLDPASCREANEIVGAKNYWTLKDNGLMQDWNAGTVFLNHPGSQAKIDGKTASAIWWEKFYTEFYKGNFTHAIWLGYSIEQLCLNPSMLDWFVCFMRKRIHFIPQKTYSKKVWLAGKYKIKLLPKKKKSSPSHSNFILLLSDNSDVINRFGKEFGEVGKVICGVEVKNWD